MTRKLIALFVILIYISFVYGQKKDSDYDPDTLIISSNSDKIPDDFIGDVLVKSGVAKDVPNNFKGTITVESEGGINVPNTPDNFDGIIKIKGGTVHFSNNVVFTGKDGEYTKSNGFTIKDGYLNDVHIQNANSVTYSDQERTVTGTTNHICKDANKNDICKVAGQNIGENTEFTYNRDTNTLTPKPRPGTTTLPNAKISKEGFDYILGDKISGNYVILNLKDPDDPDKVVPLILKKGDSIEVGGIKKVAKYKDAEVIIVEDRLDAHSIIIKPVLKALVEQELYENLNSISDVFKAAKYGDGNFQARKKWYESTYGGKYEGTASQNTKALDDLKNGEVELYYNDEDSNVRIIKKGSRAGPIPRPGYPLPEDALLDPGQNVYVKSYDKKVVLNNLDDETLRHIVKVSEENGIPPILLIMTGATETNLNKDPKCRGDSCGIMQIRPRTAEGLGFTYDEIKKWDKGLEAGAELLGQLNERYSKIPTPQRYAYIMAAYKMGVKGFETNGVVYSTGIYLQKGEQFRKELEPEVNKRLSKLKWKF